MNMELQRAENTCSESNQVTSSLHTQLPHFVALVLFSKSKKHLKMVSVGVSKELVDNCTLVSAGEG